MVADQPDAAARRAILRSRGLRALSSVRGQAWHRARRVWHEGTKGSGASLMGGKQRGSGGFEQELDALAAVGSRPTTRSMLAMC